MLQIIHQKQRNHWDKPYTKLNLFNRINPKPKCIHTPYIHKWVMLDLNLLTKILNIECIYHRHLQPRNIHHLLH
jgi:hypothetical protein